MAYDYLLPELDAHAYRIKPVESVVHSNAATDLHRNVYCVLGVPIDVETMEGALQKIYAASLKDAPFLITTPNVNFLANSVRDRVFRDYLIQSSLSLADGLPIVVIAKLLGIPIPRRLAGSDLLSALADPNTRMPIKLFLFGGEADVAEAARRAINQKRGDTTCVGCLYPGYGTADELNQSEFVEAINESEARFLVVALNAVKGQAWLHHNHHSLKTPVRANLGAAMGFESGKLKRAPLAVRKCGFEWLWRIKEEPHLWRRYANDARIFLKILLTQLIPLLMINRLQEYRTGAAELRIETATAANHACLTLVGSASKFQLSFARLALQDAFDRGASHMTLNISQLHFADARFLGLLLMVRKELASRGGALEIVGATKRIRRLFRLNGVGYLLESQGQNSC